MNGHADTIDLVEVAGTVRRRWRLIAVFTLAGVLAALAVIIVAPRRFKSSASVVVRATSNSGASLLTGLGFGGATAGDASGAGGLLSSATRSPLETEIQILSSRAVVGQVVDSLLLQAHVVSPSGRPTTDFIASLQLPGSFRPRKYRFERADTGRQYRVGGNGIRALAAPGRPVSLPIGTITLRTGGALPPSFELQFFDQEDAITRTQRRLKVAKAGGEVLKVSFRAPDSATAASVPNALVDLYLARRKTTDRGVNQHRVEFLTAQLDTAARRLATKERELRRFQEASGVIDPQVVGKLTLEQAGDLRKELGSIDVERGALDQLIKQVTTGRMSARQLAAYPSFLKSPAINDLVGRLSTLETERTKLLERRLETDAEVVALTQSIENVEAQLLPLATTYATSLAKQRADLVGQIRSIQASLGAFPGAAESGNRLQRDVLRLGQIYGALQAQLVEARLRAIGEGGDVRQLDVAEPPKKVAFPSPMATMGIGLGGGLLLGVLAALLSGLLGRWMDDPHTIERATGIPALRFDPGAPLLVSGRPVSNTVLLIPLDGRTSTAEVARRLAQTALARSTQPTVLDLSAYGINGNGAGPAASDAVVTSVSATIDRLEKDYGMVIVQLPGLTADATAAALRETRPVLLVTANGRVDRSRLVGAVQTLKRLDVPCAGIVLSGAEADAITAG